MKLGLSLGMGVCGPLVPWVPSNENWGLLHLPGNYNATTGVWTGTASAGASGGRNLAPDAPGPNPADGGGGYPYWASNVVTSRLRSATPITFPNWTSYAAGTVVSIYKSDTNFSGTLFNNILGFSSDIQLSQGIDTAPPNNNAAFGQIVTSGGAKSVTIVNNASVGVWQLAILRWDSTNVGLKMNGNPFVLAAAGAVVGTDVARFSTGLSGSGTTRTLSERMVGTSPTAFSDTTCNSIYAWALASGFLS